MSKRNYTAHQCTRMAMAIEQELYARFGWIFIFTIKPNGSFDWHSVYGQDRYDLYPNMSKDEADKAIVKDVEEIIGKQLPGARIRGYQQSGQWHGVPQDSTQC